MSSSTIRQIHSIISRALNTAVRWEWIASNPATAAARPRQKPPEPKPPTAAEAAKLIDQAFAMDEARGTPVWSDWIDRFGEAVQIRDLAGQLTVDLRPQWPVVQGRLREQARSRKFI